MPGERPIPRNMLREYVPNTSAVFRYVTIRDLTQETKLGRYGRVTRGRQVLVST